MAGRIASILAPGLPLGAVIALAWTLFSLSGCASQPPALPANASLTPVQADLMQQLRSRDAVERSNAVCEIGNLKGDGAFAVPTLVRMLNDQRVYYWENGNGHVRSIPAALAAEALLKIGTAAVEPLMAAARDRRPNVRARAVYALAGIGDARAIDTLARALNDPNVDVRHTAATWIRQKDDRLRDALIKRLKDPNDGVRWAVSKAMYDYREDPRALQPLIEALSDDSVDVRASAATTLGSLGDSPATPVLIRILDDESSDDYVRAYAALALGSAKGEDSFAALMRALDSPVWDARSGAIQAIKQRRDPRAVPRLLVSLENENMTERLLAAEALGAIGDPRALEPLKARMNDSQPAVREKTIAALEEIERRGESP